jgi:hypothetical protein
MAVTYGRCKFEKPFQFRNANATAVSLLKPGSRSGLKYPLGLLDSSVYSLYKIVFKAGAVGVVIEIFTKYPRGEL